jgi:hypothetical protein
MTRWVTNAQDELDRDKVIIWLAIFGAAALIVSVLYQTFHNPDAEISGVLWMAGILVAPLTGVGLGHGFGLGVGKAQTKAVLAGQVPGRRASDTAEDQAQ